jgi:hypothetical protein
VKNDAVAIVKLPFPPPEGIVPDPLIAPLWVTVQLEAPLFIITNVSPSSPMTSVAVADQLEQLTVMMDGIAS